MNKTVTQKNIAVECPGCGGQVEWHEGYPERPFCSERCKNADFIEWANEQHKVPGSSSHDDIFSENILGNISLNNSSDDSIR